jgi:hypothetical protein
MVVGVCPKAPKIELPTSEEKAVAGQSKRLLENTKTQGPSVLLPPHHAKTARVGGPGSRTLPIHAKSGRERGPENVRGLALRPSG